MKIIGFMFLAMVNVFVLQNEVSAGQVRIANEYLSKADILNYLSILPKYEGQEWKPTNSSIFAVHNVGMNITPKQYSILARVGVRTLRSNAVAWHRIERIKGEYNWEEGDYVTEHAIENGMQVMFALIGPPQWASTKRVYQLGPYHLAMVKNLDAWNQYCLSVFKRYKGRVNYWEVWNEENAPNVWFKNGHPTDFVRLMEIAYKAAKLVDSDNIVIMGGVVGPEEEARFGGNNFLVKAFESGLDKWLDVYAVHYTANNWVRYQWIRANIEKYGSLQKPIWNTEENYRGSDDDIAKIYLIDHFLQRMDKVFYFVVRDIRDPKGRLLCDGLFDLSGNPKSELVAYSEVTHFLEDRVFEGVYVVDGVVCFLFSRKKSLHGLDAIVWRISTDQFSSEVDFDNELSFILKKQEIEPSYWIFPVKVESWKLCDAFGRACSQIAGVKTSVKISIGSHPLYLQCLVRNKDKALEQLLDYISTSNRVLLRCND